VTVAKPKFRKVFAKAASTWTSLGVAGSALVAAAALGSWPLLAVGGAAYAALVAWDLASPDFWKKALGPGGPEAARLPPPAKIKDPALRKAVEGILGARAEVARVLEETPDDVKANLGGAIGQLAELERHAALLVGRGEGLAAYLETVDADAARRELADLDARIKSARDAEARNGYQTARGARVEQLQTIQELDDALDRIRAQLSTLVATLEGLGPKIVRMRALDAQALDELSGSMKDELSHMNSEIRVFEETLKSLAEVTGP
jgi:hypothetical protein